MICKLSHSCVKSYQLTQVSLVDELLRRVRLALIHHSLIVCSALITLTWVALVHSIVIGATLEPGVLVEGLFVDALLLFLLLLLHVVVDLFLLGVEDP